MPGRFALYASAEQLADIFSVQLPEKVVPRYNISPSQQVAVIRNLGGENHLDFMKWGLVPSWADDMAIGYKLINARSETVFEKNSFKRAIRTRRCLVPISGFYEWQSFGSAKTPFYITMADNKPFALAGIWEQWKNPDGSIIETCAILTTTPNRLIETIHDRMPVILHPQEYSVWLDREVSDPATLKQLFKPYPAEVMTAFQVSSIVNSVRNDGEECIIKVDSQDDTGLLFN
jgi:putative SOS response-associated peptidase YedK